jgi:heterodisulfide reductase subunit C/quinone-modifying oxidoreductase subunit QmoC
MGFVENYGRSFEFGLATRYHLTHSPLRKVGIGPMGLEMISKDRMALRPEKIKGIGQLRAILETAKSLEGM